jgi:hypothetical protein
MHFYCRFYLLFFTGLGFDSSFQTNTFPIVSKLDENQKLTTQNEELSFKETVDDSGELVLKLLNKNHGVDIDNANFALLPKHDDMAWMVLHFLQLQAFPRQ